MAADGGPVMTITHEDLLTLVRVALEKLASDDGVSHDQRISELLFIRNFCNKAAQAKCPCALAEAMNGGWEA